MPWRSRAAVRATPSSSTTAATPIPWWSQARPGRRTTRCTATSRQQWLDDIAALGAQGNAICKISGIVARGGPGWTAEDLAPTVDHCIDCFGEDRIVFGSDWPVCVPASPLAGWVTALREIVSRRPERLQHKLLHGNAERIYRLP